ncbi:unnamed protein product [Rotaria sordida]|uniref:Uncharacterized protein n=1 Tax=Rotaria sordida TaxID=392033 RepID=A0A814UC65_9BILA|nr:unnamed protein product [Rotaria sordida]CAF1172915.1 unnamed protein product [Rotaria sordida]CAF3676636.1 unnamed protein product [Rotaria sordida]CAF3705942.1 unnamed protein product [Rotaria sordida]
MVESGDSSMFLILQRARMKNDHDEQIWTSYIDRQQQQQKAVPMMHVRPFQHNARLLYSVIQNDFTKLRTQLKYQNYILLKSTKSNIWYICHTHVIDEKFSEYMLQTKAYVEIENLNLPNRQGKVQQLLNTMVNEIETLLKDLCHHQLITRFQYNQMNIRYSSVRLDYMLFNPDTCQQEQIIFEPMTISTINPLMPICRYLHRLLAPIYYNHVAYQMTVVKGADLVPRLEHYQQQGYLKSTTYFVSLHIKNSYTSITHSQLLNTLKCFFDDFVMEETIEGMNTMAILKLTEFLLQHQYFIHQNHIYQQISGGGTGLYLIELLIDIYLFYWQQPLLLYQNQHELFVRCFSDLFLTWNEPEEKLHEILNDMKKNNSYLQYDINIQTEHIHYLDVQIHHWHKQTLQTEIYHDWKYEPYILPTIYDSSTFFPWNLIQTALIRAVLCCSQIEDFENEQQYIEYSFLFNRFSFEFIRQNIQNFFIYFKVFDLMIYHDQTTYDELRRHVRQYDQEKKQEKMKHREEGQKQCIWYIYSTLKRQALARAKQNPKQLLPSFLYDDENLSGMTIEVVGLPDYPFGTS